MYFSKNGALERLLRASIRQANKKTEYESDDCYTLFVLKRMRGLATFSLFHILFSTNIILSSEKTNSQFKTLTSKNLDKVLNHNKLYPCCAKINASQNPCFLNIQKSKSQGVKSQGVKSRNEKRQETIQKLIANCKEPCTLNEISEYLGYSDKYRMKRVYIDPLLGDVLIMTSAETKTDPKQKYVVKKKFV